MYSEPDPTPEQYLEWLEEHKGRRAPERIHKRLALLRVEQKRVADIEASIMKEMNIWAQQS